MDLPLPVDQPSPWYYYLNGELIKQPKPCGVGAYVHTNRWNGTYQVSKVSMYGFTITKHHRLVTLPWSEFRCLKGQGQSVEAKRKAKAIKRRKLAIIQIMIKGL